MVFVDREPFYFIWGVTLSKNTGGQAACGTRRHPIKVTGSFDRRRRTARAEARGSFGIGAAPRGLKPAARLG